MSRTSLYGAMLAPEASLILPALHYVMRIQLAAGAIKTRAGIRDGMEMRRDGDMQRSDRNIIS